MKKILSLLTMMILMSTILIGCSNKKSEPAASDETLKVDKEKKEVVMLTEVNAKYFTEPTRHAIVYKDGSNGEKSILRGLADEKKFYDALISIGATPGNNVDFEAMKKGGVSVDGSKLKVFVTWEGLGKEIPISDIVKTSDKRPMDIRFGGNLERAKEKNTGCVLCLDSCAVGITSDASYKTGESKTIDFYGDESVLPNDATKVMVKFTLAK